MGEKQEASTALGEKQEASTALEEISERCSAPEPMAEAPWLVKQYIEKGITTHAFYNIFKPNNGTCTEFIPELTATSFYQKPSHQGWLIIICDHKDYDYTPSSWKYGDCFLWNPMTKERIQLPALLEFWKGDYGFVDCILSSSPCILSSSPRKDANMNLNLNNDNDSIAIFIFSNRHEEDGYTFLFCRPGETQWTRQKLSPDIAGLIRNGRKSLLRFKGKLYLLCGDRDHLDDHLDEHHLEIEHFSRDTDLTISIKSFHVKKEVLLPIIGKAEADWPRYVESHDELFRVDIIRSRSNREVLSIQVSRLNFQLMEWDKVNNIGDLVLFVGTNHNTAAWCSASELGLSSGCLYYFGMRYDQSVYKFEIKSTGNTAINLQCLWPMEEFSCTDWVTMPANVHGRVENVLGRKDEENGLLTTLKVETSTSTAIVNDENQSGKWDEGEDEAACSWNNLYEEILGLITNHLHGSDYKHFRSACKEYREIIPKVQTTSYLSPWLIFSRDHNYTIFNVVNPMYNDENYVINMPETAASTIRFQKGGWLLITRKHSIFFYNPFIREKIKLPDMDRSNWYSVVSFSSLPTCSDCVVFAMDERRKEIHIELIRKGEAHWSSYTFDSITIGIYVPFLDTAFFRDEAFFCVDHHGNVGVFSTKDNSWKVEPHEIKEPDETCSNDSSRGYLVDCGGDLLLVKLEHYEEPIRIFRLNFSDMEWVKVESLGEHVLFISQTSCVSAVAPVDYMKNKIYFPRLYRNGGGIVFYSFETCSYHTLGIEHSAKDLHDTEGWLENCTWIQPNRLKSSTEGLDWFKIPF